jgi:hypothetical protein
MKYERKERFAGSITYQPRTVLSAVKLEVLRRSLIHAGLLKEPENPAIVIDWYLEVRDTGGVVGQRYVVLYRDGGDSEEPACVFYRKDVNRRENRISEYLHIPSREDQPRLTAAWQWLHDPEGNQLQILIDYLDQIVGEESLWQSLS